jgi:hypothetical protein
MKKSTKTVFQIIISLLFGLTMLLGLSLTLLKLNEDETLLSVIVLGALSTLNTFLWLYYELKNAPQLDDRE